MRAWTTALLVGIALGVAGCAGASSAPPARAPIGLDDAIARFSDPAATERAPSRRASGSQHPGLPAAADARRHGGGTLAASDAALGSSRARVDVRLHDADLENALRMLADAARVPLVIDGDLAGTVTIELRRVDPIRALAAIAAAHGARVERAGGALVVRGP